MAPSLVDPVPPPPLNIPAADAIVKVSIIDSTTFIKLPMDPFFEPHYKGMDDWTGLSYSFLIEHEPSKTKLLFDLGVRKDWENMPPAIVDKIKEKDWTVKVERNVSEILASNSIDVNEGAINAVIWSHHHWDHTGDVAGTMPLSTDLVVGPGFKAAHLPGYPDNPKGAVLSADFQNRTVREIDPSSEGNGLRLGRFAGYDYFGDGSFYLLDTPGHSKGHICGLARTTSSSSSSSSSTSPRSPSTEDKATFIFMGGDACHHGGEWRPTKYLPLPKTIEPSPLPKRHPHSCPGELLRDAHRNKRADQPYYLVRESFADDLKVANETIDGVGEFDAHENIFVLIAHDQSTKGQLRLFPEDANGWFAEGVAEKVKWRFLGDFAGAVNE